MNWVFQTGNRPEPPLPFLPADQRPQVAITLGHPRSIFVQFGLFSVGKKILNSSKGRSCRKKFFSNSFLILKNWSHLEVYKLGNELVFYINML
jgi:hypothetical protein